MARALVPAAWLALLSLVLAGCPRRPADPAELLAEVAEPGTLELLGAVGERPMVVVLLHPGAWAEGAQALGGLLQGLGLPEVERVLAAPDVWAAAGALLEQLAGRRAPGLSGALPGWDPSRPLALALFEPSVDDSVLAARALMLEAAATGTTGVRHRLLVPAQDSRALAGALLEALGALGLQADPGARALPGLRGGQALRLPGGEGGLLLLVPEARWLRLELVLEDSRGFAGEAARLAALEPLLAPPRAGLGPITPALLHLAAQRELLGVWLRPWWLRDLGGQVGTSGVARAVRQVDPAHRAMLLAAGLSEVSQGYLLMDPRGVELDDLAWSLGVAPGAAGQAGPRIRVTSVLSLTEQGARVFARGLERGAALPAGELPQASVATWLRLSLADAVATAELPPGLADAEDIEALSRRVQECGAFCLLHLGLRCPVGLLRAVWRFLPAELPIPLPRGLGLAVGPLPRGLTTAPVVAAVASLPVGANLVALERAVGELRAAGARAGLGVLWRAEVRPEDTRVFFGLNESAERVFRGPEPGAEGGLLGEVVVDLGGLADGLQPEVPELATVLRRLGQLRGRSHLRGRLLQAEARLGGPAGDGDPWRAEGAELAWESPGARAAEGRGAQCLRAVTRAMTEGFRALAAVAPEHKAVLLARAMQEAGEQLPCALSDPATAEEARRLQRSMILATADLLEGELREEELGAVLAAGCAQGVQEACARQAALAARPRLALARVEPRCGAGLQWLALARLPAVGPAALPAGAGPFALAADGRATAGAALEVLRSLGARQVTLAVAGPDGAQGVAVELAEGLCSPAGDGRPAEADPAQVGLDGRPQVAAESPWKRLEVPRFQAPDEDGLEAVGIGLVKVGPGGRLEVVGGGASASPAPAGACPEDRACVDAAFAVAALAKAGLGGAPVHLDPAPDTPWADVAALAAALACQERHRERRVILGPTDQALYDRALGSGLQALHGASGLGLLGSLRGDSGQAADVLGEPGGAGIGCVGCESGLGMLPHKRKQPVISSGAPLLTGPMSKEVIQRVIRRHLPQVRYCYEKELLRDPKLAGKLKVTFTIGSQGLVTRAVVADDESLKSPAVAACVQKVIQRMKFPAPRGGGVVHVTYPFVFKSAK